MVRGLLQIVIALLGQQDAQSEPPDALRRMESARSAIETGVVEYTTETFTKSGRTVRNATARFAGRDLIWTDRGDEDGVIIRVAETGAPDKDRPEPIHYLKQHGEIWTHTELAPTSELQPASARTVCPDPRTFGVGYAFSYLDLADTLYRDRVSQPSPRKYSQRAEGDTHIVTAETDAGTTTWWIDARHGWQPARVRMALKDGRVLETRSEFSQRNGVWFPERVEHYSSTFAEGKSPTHVLRIRTAELDQPGQPKQFTPADIGVIAGSTVVDRVDGSFNPLGSGLFDGERFVTIEQFHAKRAAQTASRSASTPETGTARADVSAEPSVAPAPSSESLSNRVRETSRAESAWEAYTRRFIERYLLDSGQSQQAWAVCRSCQEQAAQYLAGKRDTLARIAARLDQIAKMQGTDRDRILRQIDGELAQFVAPLDRIFEKQLKPRLDRIPSRKQRHAVESAAKP